jgi:hypothetical protein
MFADPLGMARAASVTPDPANLYAYARNAYARNQLLNINDPSGMEDHGDGDSNGPGTATGDALGPLGDTVGGAPAAIGNGIGGPVSDVASGAGAAARGTMNGVGNLVGGAVNGSGTTIGGAPVGGLDGVAGGIAPDLGRTTGDVVNGVGSARGGVVSGLSSGVGGPNTAISGALGSLGQATENELASDTLQNQQLAFSGVLKAWTSDGINTFCIYATPLGFFTLPIQGLFKPCPLYAVPPSGPPWG